MQTQNEQKMSRAERKAHTRKQILDATIDALVEDGYEHFTIRDVAKRAGVAQGLINYHFESREELLEEAESAILTELLERVSSSLEQSPSATARERVDVLDVVLLELADAKGLLPIFSSLANRAIQDPAYRKRFLGHLEAHRTIIYDTIDHIAGDILEHAKVDKRGAATAIVALSAGLAVLQYLNPKADDVSVAMETFKSIVLDALVMRMGRALQDD